MDRHCGHRGHHMKAEARAPEAWPCRAAAAVGLGPAHTGGEGAERERGSGGSRWRHREKVSLAPPGPPAVRQHSRNCRVRLSGPSHPRQSAVPRVLRGCHSSPGTGSTAC